MLDFEVFEGHSRPPEAGPVYRAVSNDATYYVYDREPRVTLMMHVGAPSPENTMLTEDVSATSATLPVGMFSSLAAAREAAVNIDALLAVAVWYRQFGSRH